MRYYQIQLDEVRMAPSNLKQFANSPEAEGIMAGFEAEVLFRGANESRDSEESEPDYDADERTRGIRSVIRFFEGNGEHNSERDLINLEESLNNDYYEWLGEKSSEYFFANENRIVKDYVEGEDWDWNEHIAEALENAGYSPLEVMKAIDARKAIDKARNSYNQEEIEAARKEHQTAFARYLEGKEIADELLDKRVEEIIEEQSKLYYDAQENAREAFEESEGSDEEWLDDVGYIYMSDISNNYAIEWPIWTYGSDSDNEGSFSEEAAERVAVNFRNAMPNVQAVEVTNWAGKDKDPHTWYFESDASIEPDESDDLAVEIVSPPMPLKQCLETLDKFFTWLKKSGGYTNESTGFHMGVSMPEQDASTVDFTKLALFLGDKYVLEEFGRTGNNYCVSALKKIEARIKYGDVDPKKALEAMKGGLNQIASSILAKSEGFGKFTTINPKEKYIEFRSAGGQDYSEDIGKLQDTLGRYAQSMYIASHPDLERNEYQKKMYKLLSESEDDTDTIKELSKLSAGKASDQDINAWYAHMKEVLQKSQTKRVATKGQQVMVWSVRPKDSNGGSRVLAMTAEEALKLAKDDDRSWKSYPDNKFEVKPVSIATSEEIKLYNSEKASRSAEPQSGPQWEIYDKETGESLHKFANPENNNRSAITIGLAWLEAQNNVFDLRRRPLSVRPVEQSTSSSPVVTEPQNFPAARSTGGEWTGEWKVVDGLNREVYRFSGVGNSQSDANRVAREWARTQGFDGNFEVYPVMR